ncbi:MAG: L-seryl-tRNA(Sec) selenium transferase, partial [Acidobacteria bacterium]|nr:L-seryl-tRNA(Sec) selenium transferase [Acidobacteriota bacterium]
EIGQRAGRLVQELTTLEPAFSFELSPGRSTIGGGSAPGVELETALISVRSPRYSTDTLEERLRSFSPPIIARVEENRLLVDLRTVLPDQEAELQRAFTSLAAAG